MLCVLVSVSCLSALTIETMFVLKKHPVIRGVFFFVFALSLVSAQNDLELGRLRSFICI